MALVIVHIYPFKAYNCTRTTPLDKETIYLVRAQNFPKNYISYPLLRTRKCGYQGVRNVKLFGKFWVRTMWMIPKCNCLHHWHVLQVFVTDFPFFKYFAFLSHIFLANIPFIFLEEIGKPESWNGLNNHWRRSGVFIVNLNIFHTLF